VKLAENAGYGFDKMINGWKEYTGSEPEFDQGHDYTKATFYFKNKNKSGEKVGNKWGISDEQLGKSEKLILEAVSDNPEITISELSERIGIGTSAIENNIKKLKEKGLIERTGGRKEGQWMVKKQ
jgi:ATP-dependent DNA helicase RecG